MQSTPFFFAHIGRGGSAARTAAKLTMTTTDSSGPRTPYHTPTTLALSQRTDHACPSVRSLCTYDTRTCRCDCEILCRSCARTPRSTTVLRSAPTASMLSTACGCCERWTGYGRLRNRDFSRPPCSSFRYVRGSLSLKDRFA